MRSTADLVDVINATIKVSCGRVPWVILARTWDEAAAIYELLAHRRGVKNISVKVEERG